MIMTLMKKAIRSLILFLAVTLLAVSCNKTAINSIVITGEWELVHTKIYDTKNFANPIKTTRPGETGRAVYYNFIKDGQLEIREIEKLSGIEVSVIRGTWTIDGSVLILRYVAVPYEYRIDTANLTDLIIYRDYDSEGKTVRETMTFSKFKI